MRIFCEKTGRRIRQTYPIRGSAENQQTGSESCRQNEGVKARLMHTRRSGKDRVEMDPLYIHCWTNQGKREQVSKWAVRVRHKVGTTFGEWGLLFESKAILSSAHLVLRLGMQL